MTSKRIFGFGEHVLMIMSGMILLVAGAIITKLPWSASIPIATITLVANVFTAGVVLETAKEEKL